MIMRGFKSVLWVGAVGGAALSCYMVSLRVATERADLAHVERQIVDTKQDIRTLKTELDTRGRLTQLEDWNSNVLALSAPTSSQYVKNGYMLAQLATHGATVGDRANNVQMASLDTGSAAAPAQSDAPAKAEAADSKPDKAPPAASAQPMPRVVEAVAPAPRDNVTAPIRRASFDTIDAPAAPTAAKPRTDNVRETAATSAAKPAKKVKVAKAEPRPASAKKSKTIATAEPTPAKKMAKSERAKTPGAHESTRTARADHKAPAKSATKHAPTKLARADTMHAQSSGHRGGAQ